MPHYSINPNCTLKCRRQFQSLSRLLGINADVHNKTQIKDKDGNRFWDSTPAAWEFYDLEKDPEEMINQYSNPEYQEIITELKQLLKQKREEIGDTDDEFPAIKKIVKSNWEK